VGALRQVFRDLKFHRLIHSICQVGGDSLRIEVDGPLSLFSNSRRYGVAMAQFLPSLMYLARFELTARVLWGRDRSESVFRLDEKRGLKPIRLSRGQYITQEQTWFEERFALDPGPWRMERTHEVLLTASGEVVVPDIHFEHTEDGRQAFLEILGYWRRGSLEKRVAQIGDPGLAGLLLAVPRGMMADKEEPAADHSRIVWFKQVLSAGAVKDKLDALAVARQR